MIRFDTKKDYDKYFEDIQKIIDLEKENQQLQTEKEQINSLVNSCQEEIRQLKKQLETINEQANYLRKSVERKEETIIDLQNERVPYTNEYVAKLENQQKEFIEYLKNMLDDENDIFSVARVKDVLQKYKEIIGVTNE